MNYRSITACLDQDDSSKRLMEFAVTVAAAQDAHLTALYLSHVPVAVHDLYGGLGPLVVEWEKQDQERRTAGRDFLAHIASMAGINADWQVCEDLDRRTALRHVRSSDLAIIGQKKPGYTDLSQGFYDTLVLKAGRPVLFLPCTGTFSAAFDKIIVAWDGSREAARALADALPLLRQASQVSVLTATRERNAEGELADMDIAAWLARHKVKADVERDNGTPLDTAQWLLARAKNGSADLLVMGAYGHNRFSEMAFGGVTRALMQHMDLPVLMSH